MTLPYMTENREISPDGFRNALVNAFGNGERMTDYIAGLDYKHWPRRLARPSPKTCRSWMQGKTDPGLTAIVYLLRAMKQIQRDRAGNPWLAGG